MTLAPVTDDALADDLRTRIAGTVAAPGDPDYQRIAPWSAGVAVAPCAAAFVTSAQDVAEVMRFAGERGLKVAVQSTGHGALPFPLKTQLLIMAIVHVENSIRNAY